MSTTALRRQRSDGQRPGGPVRGRQASRPCQVQMHASLPSGSARTQKAGASASYTRAAAAASAGLLARPRCARNERATANRSL